MSSSVWKKKEDNIPRFIDLIFSWSISDVMNNDLYKNKVHPVLDTFVSHNHYFKSFVYPLLEETRADLRSNFTMLNCAPSCEIFDLHKSKDFKPPKKLFYNILLKPGKYEPEFGDLIALTEARPKHIDDLERPNRPYIVALVQGMRDEDSDTIPILSSKPIVFEKESKEIGEKGEKLFAVYLTNLTTNSRIWKALHPPLDGGNMKIIDSVLRIDQPAVEENCTLCVSNENVNSKLSTLSDFIDPIGLDDAQKLAVLNCVATTECGHRNSVKLIWGPPGTGKTKTIAALVFSLLKIKCRTLTCAPTNVAVLGVTKRLMSLLNGTLLYETYGLGDIVLFGNGERMKINDHDDLSDVFLDHRVDALLHCFAPLTGWRGSSESMIYLLEDPESQYRSYLAIEKEEKKGEEPDEKKEKSGEKTENKTSLKGKNGKNERSFWREKIVQDLKESKKKKPKEKGDNEKKETKESSGKENIVWTFDEFFTNKFRKIGDQLIYCITELCKHMPTSCLCFETVKSMNRVLDLLKELQLLLRKFDVSNEGIRRALKGNKLTRRIKHECLEVMNNLRGTFKVPNFFEKYQIKNFCLKNACLIFCTASSSSKLHTVGMRAIQLAIIDEAAQLKECESCIPLQLPGIKYAILVGDEKQLPAMVQSKMCEKADFGRSLFERLVILGHSKHLLNVQYRMHPSISMFPNKEFYDKKVKDGDNVVQKTYKRNYLKGNIFGSYSFIDVTNGKEDFDDRHSRKNMMEVSVLAEILSKLYKESISSKQKIRVGCISPYKAQVFAIQERLGNTYSTDTDDMFSVNVRSVDGFQGGEEDLIIISTVRCNGNGSIGFLSNLQRANVALTRARFCLWVLGNGATLLNSGSVWKRLVDDAKNRGCFYNAHEDKDLATAIGNALVDLGQLNLLFNMDSVLFKLSKWKVWFSDEFKSSMNKFPALGIKNELIALLVKLSNGWRQRRKDETLTKLEGVSSQLLECYGIKEPFKLIWTIDILREYSGDIQIIKIWDVSKRIDVPKVAKKLDVLMGNYTMNHMSRCMCKRTEGDLTLPMTWPLVDPIQDLATTFTAISLGGKKEYRVGRSDPIQDLASRSAVISLNGKKEYRVRR